MKFLFLQGLNLALLFSCTKNQEKAKPLEPATAAPAVPAPVAEMKKEEPKVLAIEGPNARTLCQKPEGFKQRMETIADVISWINALPKPLSVACFLDTLDRPLKLNANSNIFSGQPAGGVRSPRIIIFRGEKLLISVVPTGDGSHVIEFGEKTDATHSVKGELKFPVTETLAADAAYTTILSEAGTRTICFACHPGEKEAGEGFPANAFVSSYVKPSPENLVSLSRVERIFASCATQQAAECEVIQAIFHQGQVSHGEYP